uniref:glutaminyl-peptide cyclotransferase-like n=1 Tax=Myxine glutinosa TaxID=7769 RepID=UPI003590140E
MPRRKKRDTDSDTADNAHIRNGVMLKGFFAVGIVVIFYLTACFTMDLTEDTLTVRQTPWNEEYKYHNPKLLSRKVLQEICSLSDLQRMWTNDLQPMLIERVPGSSGSRTVQKHIVNKIESLSAEWTVNFDSFEDMTPYGRKVFSNIIAVLNPEAKRRLILSCHYDSKYFPNDMYGRVFVGATDSAVPCAMMLSLARALDDRLKKMKNVSTESSDLTLQLIFFDGEESFREWSDKDSLYGSRHLSKQMALTNHPVDATRTTLIDSIDLFVLMDLIGAQNPYFLNHFSETTYWFNRLVGIEKRLHHLRLLEQHYYEAQYFYKNQRAPHTQDDHVPFLQLGVPVLHLISTPFPVVWHTMDDTERNLHPVTINNLNKIIQVFVAEYLEL